MLWNRKKDFAVEDLDAEAYKEFRIMEAFAFKRNMFFVPTNEFAIYRDALKDVVRWGTSDESWLVSGGEQPKRPDRGRGIEEGAKGSARYDHQPNLGVLAFIR